MERHNSNSYSNSYSYSRNNVNGSSSSSHSLLDNPKELTMKYVGLGVGVVLVGTGVTLGMLWMKTKGKGKGKRVVNEEKEKGKAHTAASADRQLKGEEEPEKEAVKQEEEEEEASKADKESHGFGKGNEGDEIVGKQNEVHGEASGRVAKDNDEGKEGGEEEEEEDDEEDEEERNAAPSRELSQSLGARATSAFKAKDYTKAFKLYSRALSKTPSGPTGGCEEETKILLNNRGAAAEKLKRLEAAVKDYDKALEIDPFYIRVRIRRSRALENLGLAESALKDLAFLLLLERNFNFNFDHSSNQSQEDQSEGAGSNAGISTSKKVTSKSPKSTLDRKVLESADRLAFKIGSEQATKISETKFKSFQQPSSEESDKVRDSSLALLKEWTLVLIECSSAANAPSMMNPPSSIKVQELEADLEDAKEELAELVQSGATDTDTDTDTKTDAADNGNGNGNNGEGYNAIKEAEKKVADAEFDLGLALKYRKQAARATTLFRHVSRNRNASEPTRVRALLECASMYTLIGDILGAEEAVNECLKLDPNNIQAWIRSAGLLFERRCDPDAALERLGKVESCFSAGTPSTDMADYYFNRGILNSARGDLDTAMNDMQRCIDAVPNFAFAYLQLGMFNIKSGNFKEGIRLFETCCRLAPRIAEVWTTYAELLIDAGELDAAHEKLEQAFAVDPKSPMPYIAKALLLIATYSNQVEQQNQSENADKSQLSNSMEDPAKVYESALALYDQALQLDPTCQRALLEKGKLLSEIGLFNEACSCLESITGTSELGESCVFLALAKAQRDALATLEPYLHRTSE